MPTLSPKTKQVLSGLLAAVGTSAALAVEQALANPPFTLAMLLHVAEIGGLVGLAHFLPTLGTKAAIAEQVTAKVTEAVEQGK